MTSDNKFSSEFQREWKEYMDIQQQIDTTFQEQLKLEKDLYSKQKKLKATIKEQAKQKNRLLDLSGKDPEIKEKLQTISKTLQDYDRQILNPGGRFVRMFLGEVNSLNIVGDEKRKHSFKEEYEAFKYQYTFISIPMAILLLVFPNRVLDTVFQLVLMYFYLTLALRENVLRVNGSNIQAWWIRHHYLSIFLTLTLVTWPETAIYTAFRFQFYIYAAYAGFVQILQYRYQMNRLYVAKAMGKAKTMDAINSDSPQIVLERSFALLVPFIFGGHAMQLFNAYKLIEMCITQQAAAEWQAWLVGIQFLILATGNIHAMIVVLRHKWSKKKSE